MFLFNVVTSKLQVKFLASSPCFLRHKKKKNFTFNPFPHLPIQTPASLNQGATNKLAVAWR